MFLAVPGNAEKVPSFEKAKTECPWKKQGPKPPVLGQNIDVPGCSRNAEIVPCSGKVKTEYSWKKQGPKPPVLVSIVFPHRLLLAFVFSISMGMNQCYVSW